MKRIRVLMLVLFCCFVLAAWLQARPQRNPKIITFDVPGAGTAAGQGTNPNGIDAHGAIVGWYVDARNVNHGFLRARDGTISTFDVPGAGTGAYQGTVGYGLSPTGAIAGTYFDTSCLYHGFLRKPNGTITTFDAPGAGTIGGECSTSVYWLVMKGTSAENINAAGTITGIYTDPSGVGHVFLRTPDGKFTTFDAPDAGTTPVQGTWSGTFSSLNPDGAISGWYLDSSNVLHSYLRAPDGTIITFDAPGAGTGAIQGTVPLSLNPERGLAGFYLDGNSTFHGFVRAPRGTLITFDVPGAGTGFFQGTYPAGNNPAGEVTGYYTDTNNVNHGFVRAPGGALTIFDVPGAGTDAYQGTLPSMSNPSSVIVGTYVDANGVSHGFIRTP